MPLWNAKKTFNDIENHSKTRLFFIKIVSFLYEKILLSIHETSIDTLNKTWKFYIKNGLNNKILYRQRYILKNKIDAYKSEEPSHKNRIRPLSLRSAEIFTFYSLDI